MGALGKSGKVAVKDEEELGEEVEMNEDCSLEITEHRHRISLSHQGKRTTIVL